MRLILRLTSGPPGLVNAESDLAFDERGGSVGRAPTNTHILNDPTNRVSSQHANFSFDNGKFVLTDLGRNGVFFNEDPNPVGRGNRRPVINGDRIEIGPYLFAAEVSGTPDAQTRAQVEHRDPLNGLSPATTGYRGSIEQLMRTGGTEKSNTDPLFGLQPAPAIAQPPQPPFGAETAGNRQDWANLLPSEPKQAAPLSYSPTSPPLPALGDGFDDFLAGLGGFSGTPAPPSPVNSPLPAAIGSAVSTPPPATPPNTQHLDRALPPPPTLHPELNEAFPASLTPPPPIAVALASDPLDFGAPISGIPDLPLPLPARASRVAAPERTPASHLDDLMHAERPSMPAVAEPQTPNLREATPQPNFGAKASNEGLAREPLPVELERFLVVIGKDIVPIANRSAIDPVEMMRQRAQQRMKALQADLLAESSAPDAAPDTTAALNLMPRGPMPTTALLSAGLAPSTIGAIPADELHDRARLNAFWTAVGLDPTRIPPEREAELLIELGQFLRIAAQGMVQTLAMRRSVKEEMRMDQTVIHAKENNPFKFFASGDEVINGAVGTEDSGFIALPAAAQQALDDLREHSMVTMVALQEAISIVLSHFSPKAIESAMPAGLFSGRPNHQALWRKFAVMFNEFERDMDRNASQVLERAYMAAQHRVEGRRS